MSEEGVGITRRPSWLETLRQHARDWGWKRAIYWQIMQPLGKRLGFHIHYVQVAADRPDLDDPVAPEIPPGYTARLGCKEDFLSALNKIPNLDQTFVDEAFEHDDECNVTFYGDELVAFSFNTRVKAPVTDQLEIVVPAGFRYGFYPFIAYVSGDVSDTHHSAMRIDDRVPADINNILKHGVGIGNMSQIYHHSQAVHFPHDLFTG